jgi:hypothetical protein
MAADDRTDPGDRLSQAAECGQTGDLFAKLIQSDFLNHIGMM